MDAVLHLLFPEYICMKTTVRMSFCSRVLWTCVFEEKNNVLLQTMWIKCGKQNVGSRRSFGKMMNRKYMCTVCFVSTRCVECRHFSGNKKRICMVCTNINLVDRVEAIEMLRMANLEKKLGLTKIAIVRLVRLLTVAKKMRYLHLYWKDEVAQAVDGLCNSAPRRTVVLNQSTI